ncbi:type VI secretion protein [Burkholderia anthina]|nr:type VI secretion protein [Burkholderia anthina]
MKTRLEFRPNRGSGFARAASSAVMLVALTGCGVGQAVTDGAVDAAKRVFTTQVKTMSVDLVARSSLNASATGQPLSTVVRFYQLKDATTFGQLDYARLQTNDLDALNADLLATKDVVLRPGASISVTEPMNPATQVVGVVAFFREPASGAVWKLSIAKQQWKKTDPVRIDVRDNVLELSGAKERPVTRTAPLQSTPAIPVREPAATMQPGTQAQR